MPPCIVNGNVKSIEFNKKEQKWFIFQNGSDKPLKVKNLADCTFVPFPQDIPMTVQAFETDTEPQQEAPQVRKAHTNTQLKKETLQMDNTDIPELKGIMDIAGDSVWGGIVIFALVMLFKFLNKKMENESKASNEISRQCETRHTDSTVKVDNVSKEISALEKRISTLELELRYMERTKEREEPPHTHHNHRRPPNH